MSNNPVPIAVFDLGDTFDVDRLVNGPITVMWGQDDYVESSKPLTYPDVRLSFLDRLRGKRAFRVDIRLVPFAGDTLQGLGKHISRRMGIPFMADEDPENKSVWLPGAGAYKDAGHALAGGAALLHKLSGVKVGAAQIGIELMEAPNV